MAFSEAQLGNILSLAANRWPDSLFARRAETWREWRRSLEPRFDYADVMSALISLSEQKERFPSLAALIERCYAERDRRVGSERPRLSAPAAPATVSERLRVFDQAAKEVRVAAHEELTAAQKRATRSGLGALTPEALAREHARIDRLGPGEEHARALLLAGVDPGRAASAALSRARVPFPDARTGPGDAEDPGLVSEATLASPRPAAAATAP